MVSRYRYKGHARYLDNAISLHIFGVVQFITHVDIAMLSWVSGMTGNGTPVRK